MASRRKAVPARKAVAKRNKRGASGVVYAVEKQRRVGGSPPGSPPRYPGYPFRDPGGEPPDPDDNPGVNVAAIPRSVSYHRRERMNYDLEWSGAVVGWQSSWRIPLATIVGIGRGPGYDQRATSFINVERVAFKVTAYDLTRGSVQPFIAPPNPDPVALYDAIYFRIALIYDKQSAGTNPVHTYPNVFSSSMGFALNQFRDPIFTQRYEVLYDKTFRFHRGVLTYGLVEVASVGTPFYMVQGHVDHEEIFVELSGKLVHYTTDADTTTAISSGNMFYMMSQIGHDDLNVVLCSRVTYSDNL